MRVKKKKKIPKCRIWRSRNTKICSKNLKCEIRTYKSKKLGILKIIKTILNRRQIMNLDNISKTYNNNQRSYYRKKKKMSGILK